MENAKTPFRSALDKPTSDNFKRLSISGRLSYSTTTPVQAKADFLASSSADIFSLYATPASAVKPEPKVEPKTEYKFEPPKLDTASLVEPKPEARGKNAVPRSQESQSVPEMIKACVDNSIAGCMQELRNDLQNLHIDMIKQSLSQQVWKPYKWAP